MGTNERWSSIEAIIRQRLDFNELDRRYCAVCGRQGPPLSRCFGCQMVYYCGEEHQAEDWSKEHAQKCTQLEWVALGEFIQALPAQPPLPNIGDKWQTSLKEINNWKSWFSIRTNIVHLANNTANVLKTLVHLTDKRQPTDQNAVDGLLAAVTDLLTNVLTIGKAIVSFGLQPNIRPLVIHILSGFNKIDLVGYNQSSSNLPVRFHELLNMFPDNKQQQQQKYEQPQQLNPGLKQVNGKIHIESLSSSSSSVSHNTQANNNGTLLDTNVHIGSTANTATTNTVQPMVRSSNNNNNIRQPTVVQRRHHSPPSSTSPAINSTTPYRTNNTTATEMMTTTEITRNDLRPQPKPRLSLVKPSDNNIDITKSEINGSLVQRFKPVFEQPSQESNVIKQHRQSITIPYTYKKGSSTKATCLDDIISSKNVYHTPIPPPVEIPTNGRTVTNNPIISSLSTVETTHVERIPIANATNTSTISKPTIEQRTDERTIKITTNSVSSSLTMPIEIHRDQRAVINGISTNASSSSSSSSSSSENHSDERIVKPTTVNTFSIRPQPTVTTNNQLTIKPSTKSISPPHPLRPPLPAQPPLSTQPPLPTQPPLSTTNDEVIYTEVIKNREQTLSTHHNDLVKSPISPSRSFIISSTKSPNEHIYTNENSTGVAGSSNSNSYTSKTSSIYSTSDKQNSIVNPEIHYAISQIPSSQQDQSVEYDSFDDELVIDDIAKIEKSFNLNDNTDDDSFDDDENQIPNPSVPSKNSSKNFFRSTLNRLTRSNKSLDRLNTESITNDAIQELNPSNMIDTKSKKTLRSIKARHEAKKTGNLLTTYIAGDDDTTSIDSNCSTQTATSLSKSSNKMSHHRFRLFRRKVEKEFASDTEAEKHQTEQRRKKWNKKMINTAASELKAKRLLMMSDEEDDDDHHHHHHQNNHSLSNKQIKENVIQDEPHIYDHIIHDDNNNHSLSRMGKLSHETHFKSPTITLDEIRSEIQAEIAARQDIQINNQSVITSNLNLQKKRSKSVTFLDELLGDDPKQQKVNVITKNDLQMKTSTTAKRIE
ncbi:unnamed protein product, partial [Rotaria magnacalcarata]